MADRKYVKLDLSKLTAFVATVRKEVVQAVNDAADHTADVAQQLAPRSSATDHEHMADRIHVSKRATESDGQAIVDSPASYSRHVEFGTVDQDAQPFMSPAKQLGENELEERLGDLMKGWGGKRNPKLGTKLGG